jgi:hypothetical protein
VNVYLDNLDAQRTSWSISLLLEWLRRDEHVLDELADFGFGLRANPREHLERMLTDLDAHVAVLHGRPTTVRTRDAE